jgi:serine/threonine protein kinase
VSVSISTERTGEVVCLHLDGVIDERFDASGLLMQLGRSSILDLAGIKRITSFGVRRWSEGFGELQPDVKNLYLVRCPPCVVDQLNMVLNFAGRARVLSVSANGYCEKCSDDRLLSVDLFGAEPLKQLARAICPECKSPLQLEQDPQQFLRFAAQYSAKEIDPAAANILEKSGLFVVRRLGAAPTGTKMVHGEITLLEIAGTLDQRFKPKRLASGIEGHVVLDLAGVENADDAQRWNQLLDELAGATSITVVELPQKLVKLFAHREMELGRAIVGSVRLKGVCSFCGEQTAASLRPGPLTNRPRGKCEKCGLETDVDIDLADLQRLFELPAARGEMPQAVAEFLPKRAELQEAEAGAARRGDDDGLDKYRVVRPLSQGGMAEVLLAVRKGAGGFEKLIALKKIRRTMLEKKRIAVELFLNEAKIAALLNHPNIVHIFEVGEHQGDLFIAMEYVHGADARELMRNAVRVGSKVEVELELVLWIISQVAAALDHAHNSRDLSGRRLEIVHRDVSLNNIVIGLDGQVKLVDFGIATASVVGSSEGLMGKFSYMSPEQIGEQKLDGRSDVFALGVVMHEMISGRPLFRRNTDFETIGAVLNAPIPSLVASGTPPFVDAVVQRALARDRDKRYSSAREFQLALEGCLQTLGKNPSGHQLAELVQQLFPERVRPPLAGDDHPDSAERPRPESMPTTPTDRSRTYEAPASPWKNGFSTPQGALESEPTHPGTQLYATPSQVPPPAPATDTPSQEPQSNRLLWVVVAVLFIIGAGALLMSLL